MRFLTLEKSIVSDSGLRNLEKFGNFLNLDVGSKPKFLFSLVLFIIFLILKEGKIIDEVNGIDIPLITEKINKYIPLMSH
jgi:hypothetical protein